MREDALERDVLELVLQINGKLKGQLVVSVSATKEEVEQAALAHEVTLKLTQGQPPKKVIVVAELPRNAMGKVQKNILRQEYTPAWFF